MNSALLLIDIQDSFRQQPSWESINRPDIVDRANRLVADTRARGRQVIWILHSEPGSGGPFDPESGLVALQPGLAREAQDLTLVKTSHNAFTTTSLQQHLTCSGIQELVICGIRTEQCVETTTRLASDLGFSVRLVLDACATHPLPLPDGSGVLAAAELEARTAAVLSGRFASVVSLEEATAPDA